MTDSRKEAARIAGNRYMREYMRKWRADNPEKANTISCRDPGRITGLLKRKITRQICAERRRGSPILSDPKAGFWIAENVEELHQCVQGTSCTRRGDPLDRSCHEMTWEVKWHREGCFQKLLRTQQNFFGCRNQLVYFTMTWGWLRTMMV